LVGDGEVFVVSCGGEFDVVKKGFVKDFAPVSGNVAVVVTPLGKSLGGGKGGGSVGGRNLLRGSGRETLEPAGSDLTVAGGLLDG